MSPPRPFGSCAGCVVSVRAKHPTRHKGVLLGAGAEYLARLLLRDVLEVQMWTVDEAATSDVETVTANTTVGECELTMLQRGLRHLPLVDTEGRPIAMVTDQRVLGLTRRDLHQVSVTSASEPVQVVVPKEVDTASLLERLLQASQGAALLIDDEGRLAGIFTEHDAMRLAETSLRLDTSVGTLARAELDLYTIPLGTPAHVARITMLEHGIRHLVVVTAMGRLAGMLSLRDLAGLESSIIDNRLQAVVHHVAPGDDLHKAISLMVRHKVGSLPVVDEHNTPVEVITRTDVIRALVEQLSEVAG